MDLTNQHGGLLNCQRDSWNSSGKSKNQSIGKGKQEIMDLKTLNIGCSCTISHRPIHSGKDNSNRPLESLEHTPCAPKVREKFTDDLWVRPWSIYLFGRIIIMCFSTFQDTVSDNDVWLMLYQITITFTNLKYVCFAVVASTSHHSSDVVVRSW